MFAIVDILGQQLKVEEKNKYYIPKLNADADTEVSFDSVLLVSDTKGVKIGSPYVSGFKVKAKILDHIKDDKVIVFKKKRRTGYKKKGGHRQQLTHIEILKIGKSKEN